jgi:hypothetical protein
MLPALFVMAFLAFFTLLFMVHVVIAVTGQTVKFQVFFIQNTFMTIITGDILMLPL